MRILSITDRKSCRGDFYRQVEAIASGQPWGIVLREKDLEEKAYLEMAEKVSQICKTYGTRLIVNSFIEPAKMVKAGGIHLPFSKFCDKINNISEFDLKGTSIHHPEEAEQAQRLGADYIIAGHIFPTACKKNAEPRGLEFLREVCRRVTIPVFAIGGINDTNISGVIQSGAYGAAVMSGLMNCEDASEYLHRLKAMQ